MGHCLYPLLNTNLTYLVGLNICIFLRTLGNLCGFSPQHNTIYVQSQTVSKMVFDSSIVLILYIQLRQ